MEISRTEGVATVSGQRLPQPRTALGHHRAVERVAAGQSLASQAAALDRRRGRVDGVAGAAEHDRLGSVDRGDHHRQAGVGQHREDRVPVGADRQHGAPARRLLKDLSPPDGQPHGVGPGERARRVRGGDLPDAVSDHCLGPDAAFGQPAGQRRLYGEESGWAMSVRSSRPSSPRRSSSTSDHGTSRRISASHSSRVSRTTGEASYRSTAMPGH